MEEDTLSEIKTRAAMDTAVRILTSRGHTSSELARKLKSRQIKPDIVSRVVAECERLNYINDAGTAQQYLEELKKKGYGRRYVLTAMRKKGLDVEIIEDVLHRGYPESEERENAIIMLKKKLPAFNREKDPYKRKSKIYRYLYNRGFSPEVITAVVNSMAD